MWNSTFTCFGAPSLLIIAVTQDDNTALLRHTVLVHCHLDLVFHLVAVRLVKCIHISPAVSAVGDIRARIAAVFVGILVLALCIPVRGVVFV